MKKKRKGKTSWMGIKIDMEKAYDRVKWKFLARVMKCFGFPNTWIHWVMQCVTTTSFSVLINGCPFGFFQTSEGLRQGDPLSPFLFVLVSEVLARLIDREACSNNTKRFKLAKDLTPITHLQFADDLLLFAQANEGQIG